MFWAAVVFAAGIVAEEFAWRPALWLLLAAAVFVGSSLYFRQRRIGSGVALVYAALFFIAALYFQARQRPEFNTSILAFAGGDAVTLTGYVRQEVSLGASSYGQQRQTFDMAVEQAQRDQDKNPTPVHATVRLSVYGPGPLVAHVYGERLQVVARLKQARNFGNPGAFDYAGYLEDQSILALATARADHARPLPGQAGNLLGEWRARARASVIEKLRQLFPDSQARLLDAMLIGEEAFVDRDLRTDFQRSGAYHALIVSGLSVSILAAAVFWTLRRVRCAPLPATLITIAFCCAFAFLTQEGAPVWRATSMNAIYLIARLLYRQSSAANALGAAALGVLAFDPRQLFTASFQRRFSACSPSVRLPCPCLSAFRNGCVPPSPTGTPMATPARSIPGRRSCAWTCRPSPARFLNSSAWPPHRAWFAEPRVLSVPGLNCSRSRCSSRPDSPCPSRSTSIAQSRSRLPPI